MASNKIYYVGLPSSRRLEDFGGTAHDLNTILDSLKPGATVYVTTLERHVFIRVTEKYPGGAPSLRSFFDICGMPECGRPSTDPVHY